MDVNVLNNPNHLVQPYLKTAKKGAWRSIADLPTDEDGDDNGFVLIWFEGDTEIGETIVPLRWDDPSFYCSSEEDEKARWARIKDVVLLPNREEE